MRRNQHPLPPRPGNRRNNSGHNSGQPAASSSSSTPNNYGYANNASGGYGGYNASGGYNPAGGYPGYGYNASGGYPAYSAYGYGAGAYNASGGYPAYAAYGQPQQAWRNCSHAGCSFAGPGDQMAAHEASHSNPNSRAGKIDWSAFAPAPAGQRSEEEEAAARRLGGGNGRAPMIPGTGIRLETDEDVAKWIAERKKKFPTKERAKEKVGPRASAIARIADIRRRKTRRPSRGARIRARSGRWTLLLPLRSGDASLSSDRRWSGPRPSEDVAEDEEEGRSVEGAEDGEEGLAPSSRTRPPRAIRQVTVPVVLRAIPPTRTLIPTPKSTERCQNSLRSSLRRKRTQRRSSRLRTRRKSPNRRGQCASSSRAPESADTAPSVGSSTHGLSPPQRRLRRRRSPRGRRNPRHRASRCRRSRTCSRVAACSET